MDATVKILSFCDRNTVEDPELLTGKLVSTLKGRVQTKIKSLNFLWRVPQASTSWFSASKIINCVKCAYELISTKTFSFTTCQHINAFVHSKRHIVSFLYQSYSKIHHIHGLSSLTSSNVLPNHTFPRCASKIISRIAKIVEVWSPPHPFHLL